MYELDPLRLYPHSSLVNQEMMISSRLVGRGYTRGEARRAASEAMAAGESYSTLLEAVNAIERRIPGYIHIAEWV